MDAMLKTKHPVSRLTIILLLSILLMIIALIIGKQFVHVLDQPVASMGKTTHPQLHIEYQMEKTGSDQVSDSSNHGLWVVDHYQEYEVHMNEEGKVIEKRPTNKEEHLRYWKPAD